VIKFVLVFLLFLTGCSSFKEDISKYVAAEVKAKIESTIDERLAIKGLSIAEIKSELDLRQDGKITKEDLKSSVIDITKDSLVIEARRIVDAKLAHLEANMASKDQLDSRGSSAFNYLLVTLLGYAATYLATHFKTNSRFSKIETAILGEEKEEKT